MIREHVAIKKKNIFIVLIKFVAMSMMITGHIYKL